MCLPVMDPDLEIRWGVGVGGIPLALPAFLRSVSFFFLSFFFFTKIREGGARPHGPLP